MPARAGLARFQKTGILYRSITLCEETNATDSSRLKLTRRIVHVIGSRCPDDDHLELSGVYLAEQRPLFTIHSLSSFSSACLWPLQVSAFGRGSYGALFGCCTSCRESFFTCVGIHCQICQMSLSSSPYKYVGRDYIV